MVRKIGWIKHCTLVILFTADLTPNFSESSYIYPYYRWHKLCSDSTNIPAVLRTIIQALDKTSCYTIIQALQGSIAYKLPWLYIREMVLQNYPSFIF